MAKKGYIEIEKPLFLFIVFVIVILCFLTALFGVSYFNLKETPTTQSIPEEDDSLLRYEHCQSTKRLSNETGVPANYDCSQIRIMIQTDVYPAYQGTYECQDIPEGKWRWASTYTSYNTKDEFVTRYLLGCT